MGKKPRRNPPACRGKASPRRPAAARAADQILRAYEDKDRWVNRMILGDSLVVMNSLLHYEGLGGQIQMIYMAPPGGGASPSRAGPGRHPRAGGQGPAPADRRAQRAVL